MFAHESKTGDGAAGKEVDDFRNVVSTVVIEPGTSASTAARKALAIAASFCSSKAGLHGRTPASASCRSVFCKLAVFDAIVNNSQSFAPSW
jgi:hypothetical protein